MKRKLDFNIKNSLHWAEVNNKIRLIYRSWPIQHCVSSNKRMSLGICCESESSPLDLLNTHVGDVYIDIWFKYDIIIAHFH